MIELKTTYATREVYMQEETAWALAQERELWQRDREARATIAERERERERSQLQNELVILHGYAMILIGELRVARIPILPSSHIPSQGPIVPSYELGYMPAPLGPPSSWGSFAQTQEPSTGPFTDDDDDNDID